MTHSPGPATLRARILALLQTRGGRFTALALPGVAVVCAFLPLADHLGFELALALSIASAIAAPSVGVAAIRLDRDLPEEQWRPGSAAFVAALFSLLALIPAVLLILLNGLRRPVCEPLGGLVWVAVLAVPSAWLAASVGAFARTRAASGQGAVVRIIAIEILSLVVGLSSIYRGPAFFLFDHFFGYFPGPLYDEVVALSPTLFIFRAMTLLWGAAAMLACAAAVNARSWTRFAAALLAFALVGTSLLFGTKLGFRVTDHSLAEALGGVVRIDHLEIHHPREWTDAQVAELTQDAAFRAAQVEAALGLAHPRTIKIWMYRSPDEKRRLVGAASTSFAKPWRREVHVHASGFPHPVLRHELVHAFAGALARGPFEVPGGVLPNTPLIEGFAVAFDADGEGLTTTQWAKALRDLKLAPDMAALLSPRGFFAAAPARAYTYAGAFLRFLEAEFGRAKVLDLYGTGDLATLGDPAAIVAQFEASLDAVVVGPDERAAAQRRYARPSVFHRPCAREVSEIVAEARGLAAQRRPAEAMARFETACDLEPDDPALLRQLLSTAIRARDPRQPELEKRLLEHPKLDASLRAAALIELGDAAWKRGADEAARARYAEAAGLAIDSGTHRAAVARVQALSEPERAVLLEPLLAESEAGLGQLFRMRSYLDRHPEDALVSYLLGRQLVQREGRAEGLPILEKAHRLGLGDRELVRENLRLVARAAAEEHQCDQAQAFQRELAAQGGSLADDASVGDWVERCRFEATRGWPVRGRAP